MNISLCVVCASNQNRSMEAHKVLKNAGYQVKSFGTGKSVKMPGPTPDRPNVYEFGTPYDEMYKDLYFKDKQLYTQNGLLEMLDRNRNIKQAPEKFQLSKEHFDVVICCEERVFDSALEDLMTRDRKYMRFVHLINIDIVDNHESACIGGQLILKLVEMINQSKDMDTEIEDILTRFQTETNAKVLYSPTFQ